MTDKLHSVRGVFQIWSVQVIYEDKDGNLFSQPEFFPTRKMAQTFLNNVREKIINEKESVQE